MQCCFLSLHSNILGTSLNMNLSFTLSISQFIADKSQISNQLPHSLKQATNIVNLFPNLFKIWASNQVLNKMPPFSPLRYLAQNFLPIGAFEHNAKWTCCGYHHCGNPLILTSPASQHKTCNIHTYLLQVATYKDLCPYASLPKSLLSLCNNH